MSGQLAQKLLEEISRMEIINTHEHLINQEMLANIGFDLFQSIEFHYLKDSLLSMGMDENLISNNASDLDRLIDELTPFLKRIKNTTYYQGFFQPLRDLHGLGEDDFDKESLKAASENMKAAYQREDYYEEVIWGKCRNKYVLRDMEYMPTDNDFVKPVMRMDCHLIQRHKNLLQHWLEREKILTFRIGDADYEKNVRTLDDYLAIIDKDFEDLLQFGAIAIKIAMAYRRTLQFDKVSVDEADRAFKLSDEKTTWSDIKAFQDYILFYIIESAARHNLPVQIHTGLLAGGRNNLANTNPLHLTNLFLEFPHVQFDIFHGGFPFMGELGSLALMFPNVYLDTCWLPLISYESFKRAFKEWLCYVPMGKFMWGGDCSCPEGIYGAVWLVRHALSEALADKVEAGQMDEEFALAVARGILFDNASEFFGL